MVQGRARQQRVFIFVGAILAALVVAAPAFADPFVPAALRDAATARPTATFKVIVQGAPHVSSRAVASDVQTQERSHPGREHGLRRTFRSLSGIAAELTGRQVLDLASSRHILAITPDVPLAANVADLPANVIPPAISGTPQAGETLSVLNGEWSGLADPVAFTYQWLRCDPACSPIEGADASSYTAIAGDIGSTLGVRVTAADANGLSVSAAAAPSPVVLAAPAPVLQLVPPANVSAPTVSQSGGTLTAVEGTWSVVVPVSFSWQWQRCSPLGDACVDVVGATTSTYLVSGGDAGSTLRVVVSAHDAGGSAAASSAATAVVAVQGLAASVAPTISGEGTLTATAGEWTGGTAPLSFAWEWQRCDSSGAHCADIAGATSPRYEVAAGDAGSTLVVTVTATDAGGATASARSVAVSIASVPAVVDPLAVEAQPTVSGDGTLTATAGKWRGGVAPLSFAWQWQRCDLHGAKCADIDGATSAAYAVVAGDAGSTLVATVTATDADGATVSAASNAVPVAVALAAAAPPTITGEATLTATAGEWTGGAAPLKFAWQWQRCDSDGANCADIDGATAESYHLVDADPGSALVVTVTATDAGGATATSSSDALAIAFPPRSAEAPSLYDGKPVEGATIQASLGEWLGTQPIDLAYQWQRCDEAGAGCIDIAGATDSSYDVSADDVGGTLRVEVLATNAGGSSTAVSPVSARIAPQSASGFWNWQLWPYATHADALWNDNAPPAIAVVDSGVDASLPGLAGAVSQQVALTTLPQRDAADGYGHGSFVAQVAAGRAPGDAGAAPRAPIVSLDVMDDNGMALTSDVIAAADWIAANGAAAGVRVANFSLLGASPSSMQYDPLDRALEQLWLSGVVVVTAAGNYAVDGASSDAAYAPANDPFVITVGAADVAGTLTPDDDFAAPWSAYGHTLDGFAKPELGAPGRYVTEAVPTDSTLYAARADRIVSPGRLQLSGTSFAAPVVSGVAADLLAAHPDWTPDQVKGALMLSAAEAGNAAPTSLGVGEIDAAAAAQVEDPPNPNAALDAFVVPDPAGGPTPVFDVASWGTTVQADASWGTASWGTASWGTASWGTASWGTAYWSSASWGTASWGTASWGTTAAPADNATADVLPGGAYWMTWTR